jgi:hypothetical protein
MRWGKVDSFFDFATLILTALKLFKLELDCVQQVEDYDDNINPTVLMTTVCSVVFIIET